MIEILHGARETIIYDKNINIRPHYNAENEDFPNHWQPSFELIMPIYNIYTVYVEEHEFVLYPDDIIIISPGILHKIKAPETGARYILVFDPSMFSNIKGFEKLTTMFYPYAYFSSQHLNMRNSMKENIVQLYQDYASDRPLKYASMYSNLLQFLITASDGITPTIIDTSPLSDNRSHKYSKIFQDVCKYIEENCAKDITATELADISGFSESHFVRLFKQFTNITYYNYLNQCRVKKAKSLLAVDQNLSITEVSLQSGFSSIATFNRIFKNQVKCSPTEYRNLQTL